MEKVPTRVGRNDVFAVAEPEFTKTWHPVSHERVITAVDRSISELGLKVEREQFSLTQNGAAMFGVYTMYDSRIITPAKGTYPTIIFRNSINKSASFALNVGTDTWICTNLHIAGDFLEYRKHTGLLEDESLFRFVRSGVDKMAGKMSAAVAQHEAMHGIKISERECKALAYEAISKKIVPITKMEEFDNILFGSAHKYDPTELYGFHGACTECMNDVNLANYYNFQQKQTNLKRLIGENYGALLPQVA